MDLISMDSKVLGALDERMKAIEEKTDALRRKLGDLRLKPYLDNQDVCLALDITKRTLQSYRERGLLPYSRLKHKIIYLPEDVEKLLQSAHHSKPK